VVVAALHKGYHLPWGSRWPKCCLPLLVPLGAAWGSIISSAGSSGPEFRTSRSNRGLPRSRRPARSAAPTTKGATTKLSPRCELLIFRSVRWEMGSVLPFGRDVNKQGKPFSAWLRRSLLRGLQRCSRGRFLFARPPFHRLPRSPFPRPSGSPHACSLTE